MICTMAITLATATTNLEAALAAYGRALEAQSMAIGDVSITTQPIDTLRQQVDYWQRVVDRLTASAAGARSIAKVGVWTG